MEMIVIGVFASLILGGAFGYWLGRRKAPVPEPDMLSLTRAIAAYSDPKFRALQEEVRALHTVLDRITPQKILGHWTEMLQRSSPEEAHIETLRVATAYLQEAHRVPALTSALADKDFPAKLAAVVESLQVIKGIDVPVTDITKAAGLVVLANRIEEVAQTGVKYLTFEERLELLKTTLEEIHQKGQFNRTKKFFLTAVASALAEKSRSLGWSRYEDIDLVHRRTEAERAVQRLLERHSPFHTWNKRGEHVQQMVGWITEAHTAGESFS